MAGMGDALRERGRGLASTLGDAGAFFMVDRARTGQADESELDTHLSDVGQGELTQLDRYLEGRLSGYGAVPLAAAYEAAKPFARMLPRGVQQYVPEGFRYQEGVTSPPSLGNVGAVAQGAYDANRWIPFHVSRALGGYR